MKKPHLAITKSMVIIYIKQRSMWKSRDFYNWSWSNLWLAPESYWIQRNTLNSIRGGKQPIAFIRFRWWIFRRTNELVRRNFDQQTPLFRQISQNQLRVRGEWFLSEGLSIYRSDQIQHSPRDKSIEIGLVVLYLEKFKKPDLVNRNNDLKLVRKFWTYL